MFSLGFYKRRGEATARRAAASGARVGHGYGRSHEDEELVEEQVEDIDNPDPSVYAVHGWAMVPAGARGAARGARAGASVSEAAAEASQTTSDVVKLLGIGFFVWLGFKYVLPEFIGAGKETKRATHDYSMVGRHERERREDRNERLRRDRERYDLSTKNKDAEFEAEDDHPRFRVGNVPSRVVDDDVVDGVFITR